MCAFAWRRAADLGAATYSRIAAICCGRSYSTASAGRDVLVRDVCIIGGGTSGVFSAIRLRDAGKTVALIEREHRLGGHNLTYQDAASGAKTEAGVVVIRDSPVAHAFFGRFGIQLVKFDPPPPAATVFVDFTTGKKVDLTPRDPAQAFAVYAAQLARYPFLDHGFDLPDPIPQDLLIPFGEFVKKYDLGAMVMMASKLGQGLGDLLAQPTLYVMKNFGITALKGFENGFLVPEGGDNSEIYVKALAELGENVLLGSSVISARRDAGRVWITVQTPSGQRLVEAKKLLITIPPTGESLKGFDLDAEEQSLFSQFRYSGYWTLLLRNTGIPDSHYIINVGLGTPQHLPRLPAIYEITPTGIPNLVNVKYGSPVALSDEDVTADVMAGLSRLRGAGTVRTDLEPQVALYSSHTPFELTVPVSAIQSGFYGRLNALNGHRGTFYTGAAFQAHDASLLWEYTDRVLRKLL